MTSSLDTSATTQATPFTISSDENAKFVAAEAAARFATSSAETILDWAVESFGARAVIASSMADSTLIHLALAAGKRAGRSAKDTHVLFLQTGYHFAETIGTRDVVESEYGVTMVNAAAELSLADQQDQYGPKLYERDPNKCCELRKIIPLRQTLAGYEAWITGIQRGETQARKNVPVVQFDRANGLIKINPIATWSAEQKHQYIIDNDIIVNPLIDFGYPSIGCEPCTSMPEPGADPRSGRWAGSGKTECGLHLGA